MAEFFEQALKELAQVAIQAERMLQQRPISEREGIVCGPGCGSCCVMNVSTLVTEAVAINRHLQQFSAQQRDKIIQRLDRLWLVVSGLDDEERLVVQRKCAFLDKQGICQIYPVRPLLCRSITSTAAQSCRDALSSVVFGEEQAVLMYRYQSDLYESLFIEQAKRLEARGIDGRSFQLSGLLRLLLKKPTVVEELTNGRRLDWQDLL